MTVSDDTQKSKRCPGCSRSKAPEEFYRASKTKDGKSCYCKECSNKASKDYRTRNRGRYAESYKRKDLKKYGLTLEDFNKLVESASGRCENCFAKPDGKRRHDFLCVDHDHETNEVRGLLCQSCNRGIGFLGDTVEALERAVAYLKKARP